ncbi:uncharacterized protein LOC105843109 [Hydra vulgaris]|uniref:Uncharacterized protein LOC105843109 n=1 Tax=Hydra vulgaris TaxID=6087 RepID=A0ABM4DN88_HYDVU
MHSVNVENDSKNQLSSVSLSLDERTFFIDPLHDNKLKHNNGSTRSFDEKDNQVLQKEGDCSNENVSRSTLPNYESLIEKFILDEPPKFEVVTGEKLHLELENLNNVSLSSNNMNSRQSTRCEKCIPALIFGFALSTIFALIGYGFINHSIS